MIIFVKYLKCYLSENPRYTKYKWIIFTPTVTIHLTTIPRQLGAEYKRVGVFKHD